MKFKVGQKVRLNMPGAVDHQKIVVIHDLPNTIPGVSKDYYRYIRLPKDCDGTAYTCIALESQIVNLNNEKIREKLSIK